MCRIPTSSSLCNRKLPIVSFIVFAPLVSTRGSQTHAIPWFHPVLHVRVIARRRSPVGRFSVGLPGKENGVLHFEQPLTGHAMKSGSCLLALKLIIEHQCY